MLRSGYFRFGSPPYLFPVQNDFRLCRWKFYWIGQPQKHGRSFWNFVSSCPTSLNVVTSGLGGRHIYFRYKATSGCIADNIMHRLNVFSELGYSLISSARCLSVFFWFVTLSSPVSTSYMYRSSVTTSFFSITKLIFFLNTTLPHLTSGTF